MGYAKDEFAPFLFPFCSSPFKFSVYKCREIKVL